LVTTVNDGLLGKRRISITNYGTISSRVVESIYPGKEYPVTGRVSGIKVIVGLHIINDKEVGCRETPEWACPRAICIDIIGFINTPVVCSIPFKWSGVIALGTKIPAAFKLK
jgi:hypothetical protein